MTTRSNTKLTNKQERFVQELIKGKSQRQAYTNAYPNSKKWKENSIDSAASELFNTHKVTQRYKELTERVKNRQESSAIMSSIERKKWLTDILTNQEIRLNDKLKALDILNKMDGEYITKIETTDEGFNVSINIGYEKS